MNVYFLLEDSKSMFRVFPYWLSYLLPEYKKITRLSEFEDNENCYLIQSGFGYPQIGNVLDNTLQEINEKKLNVDVVVTLFDTDDNSDEDIEYMVNKFRDIFINNDFMEDRYRVFIMKKCFETWLIGNRSKYPSEIDMKQFIEYHRFYNASIDDPELMDKPDNFSGNGAHYHLSYLQNMLDDAGFNHYSKRKPMAVSREDYLRGMLERIDNTDDMKTFRQLVDFIAFMERQ